MNLIQRSFNGHSIQVILDENGEPWFIAMEVAEVLGYSDAYEMTKSWMTTRSQTGKSPVWVPQLAGAGFRRSTSLACTRRSSRAASRKPSRSSAG